MSRFVVDCSVTMTWCFEDEADAYADKALEALKEQTALVPSLWLLETANALLTAERKGRLKKADSARFLAILNALPVIIRDDFASDALPNILSIARQQNLSSYDAAYLELAMREGVPLATLDSSLKKAAKKFGISLFAADNIT